MREFKIDTEEQNMETGTREAESGFASFMFALFQTGLFHYEKQTLEPGG